jgi:hypothetical protein
MRTPRKILLTAAAAGLLAWLPPLAKPASAAITLTSWDDESPDMESAPHRFLSAYGKYFFFALPLVLFLIYFLVMGPADMLEAGRLARQNRGGGFINRGGFGGTPSKFPFTNNNPWR